MPYRVKITHPDHAEPYYWPGAGEEPKEMSQKEAAGVIADCQRLDQSLARYARERGEGWVPRRFDLDWLKASRPVRRVA